MLRVVTIMCCAFGLALGAMAQAPPEVENLALNPSFEDDEIIQDDNSWHSWATWGDGDGLPTTVEIDETEFIDGKRSLRINSVGTVNWHFIVLNLPIPADQGDDYTVSWWTKAEKTRPLTVKFKGTDNVLSWSETDFIIPPEWEENHITAPSLSDEFKVEFFVSGSDVVMWLDFVNIYAGAYVEGIEPDGGASLSVDPAAKAAATWGALKRR